MAGPDAGETDDISLLSTGVVLARNDREIIVCTGADRVRFLNGIISGTVAGLPAGVGGHSVLLNTKGHIVAEMRVFLREADVLLVVANGQGDEVAAALTKYAIMDDFAASRRADLALLSVLGPKAALRLAGAGLMVVPLAKQPTWSHGHVADTDAWAVRVRELGADGFWVAVSPARAGEITTALDLRWLSSGAAEAARIAAGEPAWGAEITPDYFPMEVGLDGAIDYGKGCYLGQEPIVRIRDRGHLHRRLARLRFSGDVLPTAKDPIESDAKPKAGIITSAARLPGGEGIALALVHPDVPDGGEVRIRHGERVITARAASTP